jgi:hypothetical protein
MIAYRASSQPLVVVVSSHIAKWETERVRDDLIATTLRCENSLPKLEIFLVYS